MTQTTKTTQTTAIVVVLTRDGIGKTQTWRLGDLNATFSGVKVAFSFRKDHGNCGM